MRSSINLSRSVDSKTASDLIDVKSNPLDYCFYVERTILVASGAASNRIILALALDLEVNRNLANLLF